jgi:hypothetical protein
MAARCRHQLAIGGTWRKVDAAARSTLGSSMHGTMDGCDPWEFTGFILGSSGPVSYQPFTRAVSPMGSPSDMPPDRHGPLLPPDSAAIRSQSEPPPANDNYAPLRLSNRATTRPPPVPARQSPPLRDVARTAHFLSLRRDSGGSSSVRAPLVEEQCEAPPPVRERVASEQGGVPSHPIRYPLHPSASVSVSRRGTLHALPRTASLTTQLRRAAISEGTIGRGTVRGATTNTRVGVTQSRAASHSIQSNTRPIHRRRFLSRDEVTCHPHPNPQRHGRSGFRFGSPPHPACPSPVRLVLFHPIHLNRVRRRLRYGSRS